MALSIYLPAGFFLHFLARRNGMERYLPTIAAWEKSFYGAKEKRIKNGGGKNCSPKEECAAL